MIIKIDNQYRSSKYRKDEYIIDDLYLLKVTNLPEIEATHIKAIPINPIHALFAPAVYYPNKECGGLEMPTKDIPINNVSEFAQYTQIASEIAQYIEKHYDELIASLDKTILKKETMMER